MAAKKEMSKNNDQREGVAGSSETDGSREELVGKAVWAFLVIAIGLVLLANNFGYLPWRIWNYLWKYWPVFLILAGLQIAMGRSFISRLFTSVLGLVIILWILMMSIVAVKGGTATIFQPWLGLQRIENRVVQNQQRVIGENDVDTKMIDSRLVSMAVGTGNLFINDDESSDLFRVDSQYYDDEEKVTIAKGIIDRMLKIDMKTGFDIGWMFHANDLESYHVVLGRQDIPSSWEMKLDAGMVDVSLSKVKLMKANIEVGAGSTTIRLGEKSIPTGVMKINVGVGTVRLIVPKNVGLSVKHGVALGNLKVEGTRVKDDGQFKSANFGMVPKNLVLEVGIGVGSVDVERVETI